MPNPAIGTLHCNIIADENKPNYINNNSEFLD